MEQLPGRSGATFTGSPPRSDLAIRRDEERLTAQVYASDERLIRSRRPREQAHRLEPSGGELRPSVARTHPWELECQEPVPLVARGQAVDRAEGPWGGTAHHAVPRPVPDDRADAASVDACRA